MGALGLPEFWDSLDDKQRLSLLTLRKEALRKKVKCPTCLELLSVGITNIEAEADAYSRSKGKPASGRIPALSRVSGGQFFTSAALASLSSSSNVTEFATLSPVGAFELLQNEQVKDNLLKPRPDDSLLSLPAPEEEEETDDEDDALVVVAAAGGGGGTGPCFCADKYLVKFVDMLTYPRPVRRFQMLLDCTMKFGQLREMMSAEVGLESPSLLDLLVRNRRFGPEHDGSTLEQLGFKNNVQVIVSKVLGVGLEDQAGVTEKNKQFVGDLLFGHATATKDTGTSSVAGSIVESFRINRGCQILGKTLEFLARDSILRRYHAEVRARQSEMDLLAALEAEEAETEDPTKKKKKNKKKEKERKRKQEEAQKKKELETEKEREKEAKQKAHQERTEAERRARLEQQRLKEAEEEKRLREAADRRRQQQQQQARRQQEEERRIAEERRLKAEADERERKQKAEEQKRRSKETARKAAAATTAASALVQALSGGVQELSLSASKPTASSPSSGSAKPSTASASRRGRPASANTSTTTHRQEVNAVGPAPAEAEPVLMNGGHRSPPVAATPPPPPPKQQQQQSSQAERHQQQQHLQQQPEPQQQRYKAAAVGQRPTSPVGLGGVGNHTNPTSTNTSATTSSHTVSEHVVSPEPVVSHGLANAPVFAQRQPHLHIQPEAPALTASTSASSVGRTSPAPQDLGTSLPLPTSPSTHSLSTTPQQQQRLAPRFCSQCGLALVANAKFCSNCGTRVFIPGPTPAWEPQGVSVATSSAEAMSHHHHHAHQHQHPHHAPQAHAHVLTHVASPPPPSSTPQHSQPSLPSWPLTPTAGDRTYEELLALQPGSIMPGAPVPNGQQSGGGSLPIFQRIRQHDTAAQQVPVFNSAIQDRIRGYIQSSSR